MVRLLASYLASLIALSGHRACVYGHDSPPPQPPDFGTFRNPPVSVRPRFRYWIPDASVPVAPAIQDVARVKDAGAGGLEVLGYYGYETTSGYFVPVDWATYPWGGEAWQTLFNPLLEAHRENGLVMDFALADRRNTFLGGKIALGTGLGIFQATSQTYISEIAPAKIRGPLLSSYTLMNVVGQLIGTSIVYARVTMLDRASYQVPLATQWAFSGAIMLIGLIIPESPIYYLKKNNMDMAARCYRRLYHGTDHSAAIIRMKETLDYEKANELHGKQSSLLLECFRGVNWRRTRIPILAISLQQCLGMSYVGHCAYILQQAGMAASKSLMLMQVAISVGLPANIISWFLMATLGRRTIILYSTIAVGFLWLASGIAGCFPSSHTALWVVGIAMIIIMFTFGLGVGGAYPVLAAEVSASQLRAQTQGIAYMTGGFSTWLFSFVVPYMFNTEKGNLGARTGFVFAALRALGAVVVFIEFPETKGRSYRELDEVFDMGVKARKFGSFIFGNVARAEDAKEEP